MCIRDSNQPNRGTQTFAITELIDMFPSICELANVPVPDYMQGTSFVPLVKNPEQPWKKAAFSQFHRRPKVSADGKRYMGYVINTDEYHYIEWYAWNAKKGERGAFKTAELYDAINDEHETINLANDDNYAPQIALLSKQLAAGWKAALPPVQ